MSGLYCRRNLLSLAVPIFSRPRIDLQSINQVRTEGRTIYRIILHEIILKQGISRAKLPQGRLLNFGWHFYLCGYAIFFYFPQSYLSQLLAHNGFESRKKKLAQSDRLSKMEHRMFQM